jgi:hypothetical protein
MKFVIMSCKIIGFLVGLLVLVVIGAYMKDVHKNVTAGRIIFILGAPVVWFFIFKFSKIKRFILHKNELNIDDATAKKMVEIAHITHDPSEEYMSAYNLMNVGKAKQAIEKFKEIIEQYPNSESANSAKIDLEDLKQKGWDI